MDSILLWAIAVIVPAIAIVGYWLIARAQVKRTTRKLAERLDDERLLRRRVSHQVRNPLTVIYGFSEALLDTELDDPDEIRSVVTTINSEALAVSRTVENLVAASKVASDELAPRSIAFEPANEIERAVMPFRRIGAEITVDGPEVTGFGDPVLFRQIIQNLVVNAVRHGGSEISVVSTISNGSYSCIVADDGDGLPSDIASQLFPAPVIAEPESVEDADTESVEAHAEAPTPPITAVVPRIHEEGLGLGLPVSISIATEMGGTLEYERTLGATMFTLSLPTKGWPEPAEEAPPTPVTTPVDEEAPPEEAPPAPPEPVFDDPKISFDADAADAEVEDLDEPDDEVDEDAPSIEASTSS